MVAIWQTPFLSEASFRFHVLSLTASVCMSMCMSVFQPQACLYHNSSPGLQFSPCGYIHLQWSPVISYIISYHIISYHIISYHIISYHIISYHIISYAVEPLWLHSSSMKSCHIIWYHIIYHIIFHTIYHIVSHHIIYHPACSWAPVATFVFNEVLSYRIISYHIISYITSYHIIIISYIISYHLSYYTKCPIYQSAKCMGSLGTNSSELESEYNIFVRGSKFENIACKMVTILLWPQGIILLFYVAFLIFCVFYYFSLLPFGWFVITVCGSISV